MTLYQSSGSSLSCLDVDSYDDHLLKVKFFHSRWFFPVSFIMRSFIVVTIFLVIFLSWFFHCHCFVMLIFIAMILSCFFHCHAFFYRHFFSWFLIFTSLFFMTSSRHQFRLEKHHFQIIKLMLLERGKTNPASGGKKIPLLKKPQAGRIRVSASVCDRISLKVSPPPFKMLSRKITEVANCSLSALPASYFSPGLRTCKLGESSFFTTHTHTHTHRHTWSQLTGAVCCLWQPHTILIADPFFSKWKWKFLVQLTNV